MWENTDQKTPNTNTFFAVFVANNTEKRVDKTDKNIHMRVVFRKLFLDLAMK